MCKDIFNLQILLQVPCVNLIQVTQLLVIYFILKIFTKQLIAHMYATNYNVVVKKIKFKIS